MHMPRYVLAGVTVLVVFCIARAEEIYPALNNDPDGAPVGRRPYEMDWAGRDVPAHPQLVDFEDLTGWRVRCFEGAQATLIRSRQELLFGDYTARVEYTGESHASRFIIEPPEPILIPNDFTAVNLWIHGNTWSFDRNQRNAMVQVQVLVADAVGRGFSIPMDPNTFDYWFLSHRTCVSPDGSAVMYTALDGAGGRIRYPAHFVGIEVSGVHNQKLERLHFDALQFYEIQYPPLEFEPMPETLPWPTTEDTILPTLKAPAALKVQFAHDHCQWVASGDETIVFSYVPATGTFDDIRVIAGGLEFSPCRRGGILFSVDDEHIRADSTGVTAALQAFEPIPQGCRAKWELQWRGNTIAYTYELFVKGKSLIIDVAVPGRQAVRLDIGGVAGAGDVKTVYFPYLTYGGDWPKTVCASGPDGPVFIWAACDYYNSDASELFGVPAVGGEGIIPYAGGALYRPTTAGLRNPMRERVFINVSGDVQETLPNIPNPDSKNAHLAREYLWQNIGHVHQRERLSRFKAYGIDKFIACHHEVGWREGGESFTLRDRPADSIGKEALAEYGAFVRGLGYYFGTYTNYMDYAPVNENWDENNVALSPDGAWQRAWPRCYVLKPSRAVEFEAIYAPRIHERYGANAQYCDVHTAFMPWARTDYDARVPGAGKFRTQFNAYARLLQNESRVYGGPVFSEGNYHWFYAGLVDGNYATIMPYGEGWKTEPLVDFDLLKMHTKMTDFGMGFGEMFYGYQGEWKANPHRLNPWFERFTASTIAFGHIGFLTYEWGFEATLKGYYQLQALQQRYALIPVADIRYFDGERLLDTSAAILSDAYRRRHIHVVYENGLHVWVNLNLHDDWRVTLGDTTYVLPPTGFLAHKPDDILAYSAVLDNQRHELVQCEDYLYLDSRDAFVQTSAIAARGSLAVKPDGPGEWWVIPATQAEDISISRAWLGVDRDAAMRAQAVNAAGDVLARAAVRHGDAMISVVPAAHEDVVKYRLFVLEESGAAWDAEQYADALLPGATFEAALSIDAELVHPGDYLSVIIIQDDGTATAANDFPWDVEGNKARANVSMRIPKDIATGRRCWIRCTTQHAEPDFWMAVYILPPLEIQFGEDDIHVPIGESMVIETIITSNLPGKIDAACELRIGDLAPIHGAIALEQGKPQSVHWETEVPGTPVAQPLTVNVAGADARVEKTRFLCMEPASQVIADLMEVSYTPGQCLRGEEEMPYDHPGTLAMVMSSRETLDEITLDGLHMHPPYADKTGYVFVVYQIDLPEEPARLDFALGFRPGSSTEDGCVFEVRVTADGKEETLFSEQYQTLGHWARRTVDLSAYAGMSIHLKLVTDAGPDDNTYSDWALWGAPSIVRDAPLLRVRLIEVEPLDAYKAPPEPLENLTLHDLGSIKAAHIAFEGANIDAGDYAAYLYFNNIRVGTLPPAGAGAVWEGKTLSLPREALDRIGPLNTVVIRNPNHDFMKVRNLCLHFELQDGRKGSSYLAAGVYCSAAGWKYEEGLAVNIGHDLPTIRLDIPLAG